MALIRRVHIPDFIFLRKPPPKRALQDAIPKGLPLQEMLPRKGIDTSHGSAWSRMLPTLRLQEMLPRKGIDTNHKQTDTASEQDPLQEMLPRKGIDTALPN
jgi:hypothetical protein